MHWFKSLSSLKLEHNTGYEEEPTRYPQPGIDCGNRSNVDFAAW